MAFAALFRKCKTFFIRGAKSDDGVTTVEYAVMLALIVAVCLSAIGLLGQNANNTFQSVKMTSSTTLPWGTPVADGIWTSSFWNGDTAGVQKNTYDASTGTLTITNNLGTTTSNWGAGVLPSAGGNTTWTRTQ